MVPMSSATMAVMICESMCVVKCECGVRVQLLRIEHLFYFFCELCYGGYDRCRVVVIFELHDAGSQVDEHRCVIFFLRLVWKGSAILIVKLINEFGRIAKDFFFFPWYGDLLRPVVDVQLYGEFVANFCHGSKG